MLNVVKSFFSYSVPLPSDINIEGNSGVVLTGMSLLSPSPPQKKLERRHRFRHRRRNNLWEEHLVMSRHTGEFTATYHMTESSFNKLVDQLSPHLQVDEAQEWKLYGRHPTNRQTSHCCRSSFAGLEVSHTKAWLTSSISHVPPLGE
jgi:hypothetical protein